ncbi:MAG: hypothetical protein IH855_13540 [Bacteroidetes bacterium]|nr:hypothetical protein [Bacteroidota bacterium]
MTQVLHRGFLEGSTGMKWGILTLAILAVLVAPANLFATEEWEQKLMDEGWVKLNFRNFPERDRVNTTWFGHGKSKSGPASSEGPKVTPDLQ